MMLENKDIASLLALLKMAAGQWPSSEAGEVSEIELFRRDQALLEMWPEACRRVGVEAREFPAGVIKRWQQDNEPGSGKLRPPMGPSAFAVLRLITSSYSVLRPKAQSL